MHGIYIRVSTFGQNTAGQKREIQNWLHGNCGSDVKVRWFIDKATGNNLNRPEFERMQKDIFAGKIDTVVVWKLDRLSRNLRDGINTLSDWCERGLRVVSVTQQIDFSGAVGRMLVAVLLGIAEMEQEVRKERQAAGIAAGKERGIYAGRKLGTTKAKPERAKALREKGFKVKEIASALNVGEATVFRYLRQAAG